MCKIESQQGEWLTNSPSVKATVLRNGLKQSREEENGLHTFYFPQPSSIHRKLQRVTLSPAIVIIKTDNDGMFLDNKWNVNNLFCCFTGWVIIAK